jgi:patatin-like phospholipase/acyl hydrolase
VSAAVVKESRRFQILALDGGGFKGMFSAAVLAKLEKDLKTPLLSHFDLVAGTSTGGIVALGLGAGKTPSELVDFYLDKGHHIFRRGRLRMPRQVLRSKYPTPPLKVALEGIFGSQQLWESRVPLCIPSFDLRNDGVHLFRTPHSERLKRDWSIPMVDIALATSAAPTYLRAHRYDGLRLVDGGLWANNPSMVAVTEAVHEFGINLSDIRLLSLGTTNNLGKRSGRLDRGGMVQWGATVTKVILRGQALAAHNASQLMLAGDHYIRIDPDVPDKLLHLDGVNPEELMGRATFVSRSYSDKVHDIFMDHTGGAYTPLHTPKEK